jgi:hypothetical protein
VKDTQCIASSPGFQLLSRAPVQVVRTPVPVSINADSTLTVKWWETQVFDIRFERAMLRSRDELVRAARRKGVPLRHSDEKKLRTGRSGFGTARQNMRLERGTNPTRGFFSILSLSVQLVIAPSGDPTSADTPRSLHARLRWDGGTYHTCEPRHVSSGQPAVLEGM